MKISTLKNYLILARSNAKGIWKGRLKGDVPLEVRKWYRVRNEPGRARPPV